MRLVLCDDQRILVESLAVALRSRGCEVLAATTTPAECLAVVAENPPDVCLLDLYLPRPEDGLETARAIRATHPETQVLLLTGMVDPLSAAQAIDIGVAGIVRKDQKVDKIFAALLRVATSGPAFETSLIRDVVHHLVVPSGHPPGHYLTDRELEVLRRIVDGESTKQMARSMGIAASTVRTYAQNVLTKLGAHSRLEASAIAIRTRLLDEAAIGPANAWQQPGVYPYTS